MLHLRFRAARSQPRNHTSGSNRPRRRAVEFRKGRGNDRSLLAQKKRRANRRVAVAVRPEINVQFSRPVIAGGIRVGCRNFSKEGHTPAGKSDTQAERPFHSGSLLTAAVEGQSRIVIPLDWCWGRLGDWPSVLARSGVLGLIATRTNYEDIGGSS